MTTFVKKLLNLGSKKSRPALRKPSFRPGLEELETRLCLSGTGPDTHTSQLQNLANQHSGSLTAHMAMGIPSMPIQPVAGANSPAVYDVLHNLDDVRAEGGPEAVARLLDDAKKEVIVSGFGGDPSKAAALKMTPSQLMQFAATSQAFGNKATVFDSTTLDRLKNAGPEQTLRAAAQETFNISGKDAQGLDLTKLLGGVALAQQTANEADSAFWADYRKWASGGISDNDLLGILLGRAGSPNAGQPGAGGAGASKGGQSGPGGAGSPNTGQPGAGGAGASNPGQPAAGTTPGNGGGSGAANPNGLLPSKDTGTQQSGSTPGTPGAPGQPATPGESGSTGQPGAPGQQGSTGQPNDPGQSGNSGDAGTGGSQGGNTGGSDTEGDSPGKDPCSNPETLYYEDGNGPVICINRTDPNADSGSADLGHANPALAGLIIKQNGGAIAGKRGGGFTDGDPNGGGNGSAFVYVNAAGAHQQLHQVGGAVAGGTGGNVDAARERPSTPPLTTDQANLIQMKQGGSVSNPERTGDTPGNAGRHTPVAGSAPTLAGPVPRAKVGAAALSANQVGK